MMPMSCIAVAYSLKDDLLKQPTADLGARRPYVAPSQDAKSHPCTAHVNVSTHNGINVHKLTSLNLSVKDDNYDACKTANVKIQSLVKRALMCYGGTPHERLLSQSSLSYMHDCMLVYLLI
jgi:hypothetical protein